MCKMVGKYFIKSRIIHILVYKISENMTDLSMSSQEHLFQPVIHKIVAFTMKIEVFNIFL